MTLAKTSLLAVLAVLALSGCRPLEKWDEEGRKREQQKALQDKERNIERVVGPFDDSRQDNK